MSTSEEPDISELYDTIDPYSNVRQCVPVTSPKMHAWMADGGDVMILSECDDVHVAQEEGEWIECGNPTEVEQ